MKAQQRERPPRHRRRYRAAKGRVQISAYISFLVALSLFHSGCFGTSDPATYYGNVRVPQTQSFRWSDGGLPQTFDPAFAAAAPDTDVVRALFEGLTEYDPKSLTPVPAVAKRWEASSDNRLWTFYLRPDALWSNGERVTAGDFVRSWQRTLRIGPLAPHNELLKNIEGAAGSMPADQSSASSPNDTVAGSIPQRFGAEAIGDDVLRVHLRRPDPNFPALVAHPVFRPVKIPGADLTMRLEARGLISNGAFRLLATESNRVLLEAAKNYWDGASVSLRQVEFVNTPAAEDALTAYRDGNIDAITSAPFEPLALKLLSPYKDFRRSTFGALTYYTFNTSRPPFDDVRVREAFSISIDRERVTRDDLGGATEPATKFLPEEISGEQPVVSQNDLLQHDVERARELLAKAGYPDGENFPIVRLLINRNEQQRIVAQSIAAMWHAALNVQTEIVMKNWDEYEAALTSGDYDIARRGLVMQTTDEVTNLRMLFDVETPTPQPPANGKLRSNDTREHPITGADEPMTVDSEAQALKELKAVPIYFASSYALVKPYVAGFDANVLDAPSLKKTKIDTGWTESQH